MSWLNAQMLAEIHRETYVAILKSWLPHGVRGDFARRVGLTPEYFSYLCAMDSLACNQFPTRRLPSHLTAEKIVAAFPAPYDVRRSLLENMELAHVNAARSHYIVKKYIAEKRVNELLLEIGQAHRQATFGTVMPDVKRKYVIVREMAARLLSELSPVKYPASFSQVCLFLHDAQCVLDRADDALRFAKLAHLVLQSQDVYEPGFTREQADDLEINAIRGEAVAYHNLGLDREVPHLYDLCCATSAYKNAMDFWKPLVGRDLLNAMVMIPRSSIRRIQQIAHEIEIVCERKGDEFTLFLVRESWLRSLIQHERWKQAQQVLNEEIERFPGLPYAGALHHALLLKTGAQLAWKLGDHDAWLQRIQDGVRLMQQAGLIHQMRLVRQLYGDAIQPVLDDLGIL